MRRFLSTGYFFWELFNFCICFFSIVQKFSCGFFSIFTSVVKSFCCPGRSFPLSSPYSAGAGMPLALVTPAGITGFVFRGCWGNPQTQIHRVVHIHLPIFTTEPKGSHQLKKSASVFFLLQFRLGPPPLFFGIVQGTFFKT